MGFVLTVIVLLGSATLASTKMYWDATRENTSLQNDLDFCFAQQDLLYNLSDSDETDPIPSSGYRSLLAIATFYEEFIKENGNKPSQAGQVAVAYYRLGQICCRFREFEQAVQLYRQALDISEQIRVSSPQSNTATSFTAETLTSTAVALLRMQRPDEAYIPARQAYDLMQSIEESTRLPSELHTTLADCCWCLAVIASHRDDNSEAEHHARLYINLLKSRQGGATENTRNTQSLTDAHFVLIHLLDEQQRREEAIRVCTDLISILEEFVAHDPIDCNLQMYLASARVTLVDVLGCTSDSAGGSNLVAESTSHLSRQPPARRAIPPLISPEKIFNTVIHRSTLTLPAGECIVSHYHPTREYQSRAAVQGYVHWIEGDQPTTADKVRFFHNADDPFWAGGAFEYELSGTFNCHSFTFGGPLRLGRSDWVVGGPDVEANYTNPVRIILKSYFQLVEAYDVSTPELLNSTMGDFERNGGIADDDIVCFTSQADGTVVHSGRIQKVGGKNWILGKFGLSRIFLASLERTGRCFAGQFDRLEVYKLRSETLPDDPSALAEPRRSQSEGSGGHLRRVQG